MIPRFHCDGPLAAGQKVTLPEPVAHHAERVLRLSVGDDVVLFDGSGGEYLARIAAFGRQPAAVVEAFRPVEREAPLPIVLAQVVPAGERMDWLVQKAVELGVAEIAPLSSQRSVVRLTGERAEKRRRHWQNIVIGACEQCGRNRVPEVRSIIDLPRFLAESVLGGGLRLVLDPAGGAGLRDLPAPTGGTVLLVGPEGGLSDDELKAAASCGFRKLGLGPRVLRTETAGLAAIAAMLARWGDF